MSVAHREQASHQQHKAAAPRSVSCMVITCSDTRTPETDTSGALIMNTLKERGHTIAAYHLVKDEPSVIRKLIKKGAKDRHVQAIIVNGGTGISRRDSTFEAIDGLLEKRLAGFGEIFRYLSYQDIGSAAILSRATAGLYKGTVVISIPGSEKAAFLAMDKLILNELGHMVHEMSK
ncbi:MAG: MogA/MoaB family molybdenum cofactor biosynthesis protein [Nitrospirae bacterium]|nr:MAG: MogA/MoaB family molybdenum cofactor biosynthesis protein [Nitrospirota bacterium]